MIVTRDRRRGMAPLEIVLLFPLLAVLVVAVVWAGKAGSARTAALADARGQVWAERDSAEEGRVLKLDHKPLTSLVEQETANELRGRPIFSKHPWVAMAYSATTFKDWAYRAIKFAALPDAEKEIVLHLDLLWTLGERNPETLSLFAQLLPHAHGAAAVDPRKNGEVQAVVAEGGAEAISNRLEAKTALTGWPALETAMVAAAAELAKEAVRTAPYGSAYYGMLSKIVGTGAVYLPRLAAAHRVGK